MTTFYNRVKFATSTSGTGTITVGTAETGFRTPAQASIPDGAIVRYVIEDPPGSANWETGYGTYTVSGTTLSRNVLQSSNSDNLVSLSGSGTIVRITSLAEDVPEPPSSIDPTSISGCIYWIDLDQESGSEGDAIATLSDWSASNNDATQGTAANKPKLHLGVANGRKGAFFDGANDYMTFGTNIDLATNHTVLITMFPMYASNYSPLFQYKQQGIYQSLGATFYWGIYRSGDGQAGIVEGGQPQVVGVRGTSNTSYEFIHNYAHRPGLNVNAFTAQTTSYLGTDALSTGSQVHSGYIFEEVTWNVAITDAQYRAWVDWQMYKWRGIVRL